MVAMTDRTRIAIAAVTTAGFLGGVAALGLTTGSDEPDGAGRAATATVAEPGASGGTREGAPRTAEPARGTTAPAPARAFEDDDAWDDEDADRDDDHGDDHDDNDHGDDDD